MAWSRGRLPGRVRPAGDRRRSRSTRPPTAGSTPTPASPTSSTSSPASPSSPSTPSSTASAPTGPRSRSCSWPGPAASPSSTPSPSTSAPLGRAARARAARSSCTPPARTSRCSCTRCGTVPARAVRHPAGGRLLRLRHAVAGVAAAGRARRAPAQGRPPHRLAAAPARRRRPHLRRRRRRPPAAARRPAARRRLEARAGSAWAEDECETLRAPGARAAATRTRRGGGSRRPGRCGARPSAWPRRWRPGGSGGPARSTSRSASCCPTWPWSASPRSRRPTPRRLAPGPGPRRPPPPRRRRPTSSSPRSRAGAGHAEGRRYRLPPAGDVDRDLRPAVTLVSAWVSQLGPRPRHRHRRSSPPAPTSRRCLRGDAGRPAGHGLAGRGASATPCGAWSAARPPSPSTASGGLVLEAPQPAQPVVSRA